MNTYQNPKLLKKPMLIKISTTIRDNYLTGITALNIISDEGTGDWHLIDTFKGSFGRKPAPFKVAGVNTASSTKWLDESNLFDSTLFFKSRGIPTNNLPIWTANHYRAVTDIVVNLVQHQASSELAKHLQFDEWFSLLIEKNKVYSLLKIINSKEGFKTDDWKNIESWIENEIYLNHYNIVNLTDKLSEAERSKGKEHFESNFIVDKDSWSFKNN